MAGEEFGVAGEEFGAGACEFLADAVRPGDGGHVAPAGELFATERTRAATLTSTRSSARAWLSWRHRARTITPRGDEGWSTAAMIADPFGNVLGLMFGPHYLDVLRGTDAE